MSRWNSNYDWWVCLNNTATHLTLHINLICFDQTPSPTCCYLCPFIYHPTLLTASLTKAICIICGRARRCQSGTGSSIFLLGVGEVWSSSCRVMGHCSYARRQLSPVERQKKYWFCFCRSDLTHLSLLMMADDAELKRVAHSFSWSKWSFLYPADLRGLFSHSRAVVL